jgi:hypothetical protein
MRHSNGRLNRSAVVILFLLFGATIGVSAQEGVYVQGSAFADVRQFGSSSVSLVGLGLDDDFSLDATGVGGSVRVGTWLHRRWTLEAGVDLASETTSEARNPFILALFPPGRQPFDLKAGSRFTTVTTVVGFHQRASDAVRLGYRAGFGFVRASYHTEFPDVSLPASIFPGGLFPTRVSLPTVLDGSRLSHTENNSALVLGVEAAIEITDNLDVVPELRALAFSRSGAGVFLIRPGVGVRATFD